MPLGKIDPNGGDDDFEVWEPQHPAQEKEEGNNCLFGHHEQYQRKKLDHLCLIGTKIPQPLTSGDATNCSCSHQDYEW